MIKKIIFSPALFLLASCAHEVGLPDYYSQQTVEKFGSAVRQNIAAQTVNPDGPDGEALTASGARAALAQERYAEDDVETPRSPQTLLSTTQQNNSGGGGSN